jgi:hypothetical protein
VAARAGRQVRVGGNLGEPALDLLDEGAELYVLELSSYQLETADSLSLAAAVLLNISPDHLDRYGTVAAYAAAKARIFERCQTAVLNADDPLVATLPVRSPVCVRFSLHADAGAEYCLTSQAGAAWLTCRGERLLPVGRMKLAGRTLPPMRWPRWRLPMRCGCRALQRWLSCRNLPGCRIARSGWPSAAACATSMTPRARMSAPLWRQWPACRVRYW